ncbi:DMT family transporter [Pseudaeromonas sp. ZJS20]|uniref:DMT family transporter n=1 Tax=Pseudaeromonas aegiceratis TaxID=3153928 RepID=UPI00390C7EE0
MQERPALGFVLACTTMLLWGALPIALHQLLAVLDPFTLTWFRFSLSALLLGAGLAWRQGLPSLTHLLRHKGLLAVAVLGLGLNYLFCLLSLQRLDPESFNVLIQLGPILLMLMSVLLYRETFTRVQQLGALLLLVGLILFFHDRLALLVSQLAGESLGILLAIVAASCWACYGLAQKRLIQGVPAQQVMLVVYLACALAYLPFSAPAELIPMSGTLWWILLFASLNTVVSYGAFSEALCFWSATKISAVLTQVPLVTILLSQLLEMLWPGFARRAPDGWAILGACLVVGGAQLTVLGNGLLDYLRRRA